MAGGIYGQDQIDKVNGAYGPLMAHIRSLLASAANTPYGLMKVHFLIDSLDSTEMYHIFSGLTFLSPAEKKSLVRAAIYDVLVTTPEVATAKNFQAVHAPVVAKDVVVAAEAKTFSPSFKLNVNSAEAFHGSRPADISAAKPVITSTQTPRKGSK